MRPTARCYLIKISTSGDQPHPSGRSLYFGLRPYAAQSAPPPAEQSSLNGFEPSRAELYRTPEGASPFLSSPHAVYRQMPLLRVAYVWRARCRANVSDTPMITVQPTEHTAGIALPT
eukprot:IDg21484t1